MKKILPIALLAFSLTILFTFWKKTPTENSKKEASELINAESKYPIPTEIGGGDSNHESISKAASVPVFGPSVFNPKETANSPASC